MIILGRIEHEIETVKSHGRTATRDAAIFELTSLIVFGNRSVVTAITLGGVLMIIGRIVHKVKKAQQAKLDAADFSNLHESI